MPNINQTIQGLEEGFIDKPLGYQDIAASINAGGPGSGRKPANLSDDWHKALTNKGFNYRDSKRDGNDSIHTYTNGSDSQIKITHDSHTGANPEWSHLRVGQEVGAGPTLGSLQRHLSSRVQAEAGPHLGKGEPAKKHLDKINGKDKKNMINYKNKDIDL
jgi:hypothetical protein